MTGHQWIMGALGFITCGPLGAIAAIGLEKINVSSSKKGLIAEIDKRSTVIEGQRNGFLFSLLVLSSYIIQADGKVLPKELDYVLGFIRKNFSEEAAREASETLDRIFAEREKHEPAVWRKNIEECCEQLKGYMTGEQIDLLVSFLVNIVKSDNDVADEELDAMYDICRWLGVKDDRVAALDRQKEETLMSIYDNVFEISDLM